MCIKLIICSITQQKFGINLSLLYIVCLLMQMTRYILGLRVRTPWSPLSTKKLYRKFCIVYHKIGISDLESDQIAVKHLYYVIGLAPACRDVKQSALWRVSKLEVTKDTYIHTFDTKRGWMKYLL